MAKIKATIKKDSPAADIIKAAKEEKQAFKQMVESDNNKQQTAVEWLEIQYHRKDYTLSSNDFQQAKQMEKQESIVELRYKDGTPMRKYNSSKLQELEQINQDNPMTRGSTALVRITPSQTAVEWLADKVTDMIHESNHIELVSLLEQAKEMEKKQTEISDDEIDKQAEPIEQGIHRMFFKTGAKWYREQLKNK